MALIEIFHVTASKMPIDADSATDIPQGSLVALDANGYITLGDGDSATSLVVGLAADSRSSGVTGYTPESESALSRNPKTSMEGALLIGAGGGSSRYTQNKIANNYNEVIASGLMTVYHSGGEFYTDQYEIIRSGGTTVCSYTPGTALFCSGAETAGGASLGEPEAAQLGRFTDEQSTANTATGVRQLCGVVLASPHSVSNGVPGVDVEWNVNPGGNSMTWGTFLHVKLRV